MIDSQLRTSGVNEPWVLNAMASVPREQFVPAAMRDAAYIDRAIPLGNGSYLAAPLVHARMLAEANPEAGDKALLVGDEQGYLAVLLRPMVGSLHALSPEEAKGKRGKGAYALLVVDGAVEDMPKAFASLLAEGGRIVTGVLERGVTRLAQGAKVGGEIALIPLAEIGIPVIDAYRAPRRWAFEA
ncbi:MAG: protein-L-isoaspartate O-methyltransferase [Alphaproteobacteria bacterium]|nr:protein-L-isoaspartate O-methyltransferase [Alphaproteobacteria bacterium]